MIDATENQIFSVTDFSLLLKGLVEGTFAKVRIRGEVSGFKRASSGHIYFSLKDENSVIDAVSWKGQNATFSHLLQDGLEVVCTGKISTYPARSSYQIIVEKAEPAGEGALLKLLAELKKKLEAEGLFAPEKKRKIPFLPTTIGVISSPTGAVIRDIIHRISERFPSRVILWPVPVQGEDAAEKIAVAIKGFNTPSSLFPTPDVIIVARGGGSIEDLWAFNEETVVRATAESKIPLISAVGHETDTTLIDYASDLRAPTPTGAAEYAVPVRSELLSKTSLLKARIIDAVSRHLSEEQIKLTGLGRGLPNLKDIIEQYAQRLDDKAERLNLIGKLFIKNQEERLSSISRLLESYSYTKVLERGFTFITDTQGQPITSSKIAQKEETMNIHFADGEIPVSIFTAQNTKPKIKKKRTSLTTYDDKQGDLLL